MNSNLVPLLECILDRDLAHKIIERSVEVITQDGILFSKGELGDCVYFVQWGEVSLTMLVGNREIRIRAGRGSLLGLLAVFGNQPYTIDGQSRLGCRDFLD